jgi:hypothetical protein
MAAVDLSWRLAPRRSVVLSAEAGGKVSGGSSVPYSDPGLLRISSATYYGGALSIERTRDPRGIGNFQRLGIGVGRLEIDSSHPEGTRTGVLLTGTIAHRFIPDPGPLGFVLGFHTSHTIARRASSHLFALFLGLAIHDRSLPSERSMAANRTAKERTFDADSPALP